MTLRIATVPFVNAAPLMAWFATGEAPAVEISSDLPSRLGALLAADEADAALLPVVAAFRGEGGGLAPDVGIATPAAVESVKLFAWKPLSELQRVGVDRASQTSVALLQVLLGEEYGLCPELVTVEPRAAAGRPEGLDALLAIGDRCFAVEKALAEGALAEEMAAGGTAPERKAPREVRDLGAWWHDLTERPFVFAAWVLSRTAAADPARRRAVLDALSRARDHGLAHLEEIAHHEAAAGRRGPGGAATPDALYYYFSQCLRYSLGEAEWSGLRRFYELCVQHGLVPPGNPPAPVLS